MPNDNAATGPDAQEKPSEESDSGSFSNLVSEAYQSAEHLTANIKDATKSLVAGGGLPDIELSAMGGHSGDKTDASVARAGKAPSSEVLREAQATVVNPACSQEEKLRAAYEMAKAGQTTFEGPDGRRYDISVCSGSQADVSIHTNDKNGNDHAVLRGTVSSDGTVSKQYDNNGKEVSYEGTWASTNLKDSPLIGSKERADAAEPSDENKHLQQTLKDKGLDPPNQSREDRVKLDQEYGKLCDKVKAEQGKYDDIKKETDAKNAPLQAQVDKLRAQADSLGDTAAAVDVGRANAQMAKDMQAAGLGDGKPYDVSNPNTIKHISEQIDSKPGLDGHTKEKLKADLADLEKARAKSDKIEEQVEKLEDPAQKIEERIWDNKSALLDQGKHLSDARRELRANEEKIAEAKFSDDLKEIDKLPKEKREAVYKALEQIANDAGGPPNKLTPEERQKLVEQVAHQIAHPESIKQGNKGTCGLASSEFELAQKHPEKYARYVADLASKGETATAGGSHLKIQPDLINTTNKKGELVPQDDGNPDRSLASKIFQSAAANRALEIEAQGKNPPVTPGSYDTQRVGTKYPYEMPKIDRNGPKTFRPSEDTGERVVMPDGTVKQWDGMNQDDLPKLTSELTGDKYEAQHIVKGRNMDDPKQEAEAEKDFMKAIDNAGLPAKCSITLRIGDFTGMNAEGGHEIIINHVDKGPPAMVYFENTAGGSDHSYPTGKPVPLKDFLKSMSQTKMSDGNTHAEGHIVGRVKS